MISFLIFITVSIPSAIHTSIIYAEVTPSTSCSVTREVIVPTRVAGLELSRSSESRRVLRCGASHMYAACDQDASTRRVASRLATLAYPRHHGSQSAMPSPQDIIDAVFEPFDHVGIINTFNADSQADDVLREGKLRLLAFTARVRAHATRTETKMQALELLFAFHAWAAARPELEERLASERLEKEMDAVAAVEVEQGMLHDAFPRSLPA